MTGRPGPGPVPSWVVAGLDSRLRIVGGRYRLVRPLAQGGMAEVWEGFDGVLSRPVAVKMLLPHLAADASVRERFRREAITAARLAHPGIVATFDAGIDDPSGQASLAYIVMELVRGETLRDLITRAAPLPVDLSVGVAVQLTDALTYAHDQGLIHRDIKPANVLLTGGHGPLPRVKVTDFGIAKVAEALEADLTQTGMVLGTPKYLSPEQINGEEPDSRADLYALGVVLFEMLAGRPPFAAPTEMAMAMAHLRQPPPGLTSFRQDLPPDLVRLVDHLLAKRREQRPPSAATVRDVLLGAVVRDPTGGPTQGGFSTGPGPVNGPAAATGRPFPRWPDIIDEDPILLGEEATPAPSSRRSEAVGPRHWSAPDVVPTAFQRPVRPAPAPGPGPRTARPPGGDFSLHPPPGPRPSVPGPRRAGQARRRTGRDGRRVGTVVAGLVVVGAIAAYGLLAPPLGRNTKGGAGSANGPGTTASPSVTLGRLLKISGVTELTQDGNHPTDNLPELKYTFDGKASTAWQSAVYLGPNFGGFGGFGLVVALKGSHTLHALKVTTPMQGWSAEVFVGAAPAATVAGWGTPTAQASVIAGTHTFSLGGRKGEDVLLWMTDPGPTRQATIDELQVS
jgi:serine/threonine protein kinase